MKLTLPWPPKALSPNARVHHMVKAGAAKAYKHDCAWRTTVSLAATVALARGPYAPSEGPIKLALEFWPPSKRRMDIDNALARFKYGLDGIALALGVDDSRFELSIKFGAAGGKKGTVSVTL